MSNATFKVKALKGTQCPKEGAPREYITDDKAEEVPATMFYRRLIEDGSLVLEAPAVKKPAVTESLPTAETKKK